MSNNSGIVSYNNFDPKKITFGSLKSNKNGQGKNISIMYDGRPLIIRTPEMRNPFSPGISYGKEDTDQYMKKVTSTLSFDNDRNSKCAQFMERMLELENVLLKMASENLESWGIDVDVEPGSSPELVRGLVKQKMTRIVRYDKKGNNAPTMRVTYNTENDPETRLVKSITTKIFNDKGEPIDEVSQDTISSGDHVKGIISAGAVWVSAMGFGINFRFRQVMVIRSGDRHDFKKCMIERYDDDEASDETTPVGRQQSITEEPTPGEPTPGKTQETDTTQTDQPSTEQPTPEEPSSTDAPKKLSLRNRTKTSSD